MHSRWVVGVVTWMLAWRAWCPVRWGCLRGVSPSFAHATSSRLIRIACCGLRESTGGFCSGVHGARSHMAHSPSDPSAPSPPDSTVALPLCDGDAAATAAAAALPCGDAHARQSKAWAFWERIGSPKFVAGPIIGGEHFSCNVFFFVRIYSYLLM